MLKSKWILITGCSTGIGLDAALSLHSRGYSVIASVKKPEDIAVLRDKGLPHVIHLDLRSSESIDTAIEQTMALCGGQLFALFNNGAYGQPGAVEDLSRLALQKQFETNVFGTHELTVKLLPHMCDEDARIIQNSSILGFLAMPMRGAYNASKFALEGLSDTLRIELSETNTKVILIEPGPILTNFRENALQALEANVDFSKSRFQKQYQGALFRLRKAGPASRFTLGPEAVTKALVHALESKCPKPRYRVTFPTKLFACISPFLPTRILDRILVAIAQSNR
ncbi:MAG: SDR family NAD(P)-dependent oxidoreductase [Agarilytica sp.]